MAYYKDLREYIAVLEKNDLLWRIKSPIKKETELSPMVRWQYRGLSEEDRRAFLFENVTDLSGKKYDTHVLVGALAGSEKIYALGMGCRTRDEIDAKWTQAQRNPIEPRLVQKGSAQEVVYTGKQLKELGLDIIPFPNDIPGFDGVIRTTTTNFITKDPETGAINIGNYSGYVNARDRIVIGLGTAQHLATHLDKAREQGRPLEAALVVGVVPAVSFVSVGKVPYGSNEMAIACGLAGEPIDVIKCKTVDIEVPATSELVIEGKISTTEVEYATGSFGEYTGYMAEKEIYPIFDVTCITHRKNFIYQAITSQMPPSESSKIRQIAYENNMYKFLRYDCGIPGVQSVAFHESSGSWQYCVIQLKKRHHSEAWQALNCAVGYSAGIGKLIIAVDEDIDPRDPDSVNWALSFRMQPHRDTRITMGKIAQLDPSTLHPASERADRRYPPPTGASAIMIDATRKFDYPAVALPKREYMERARELWEAEGLPKLKPKSPWFGYTLGYWPEEYQEAAEYNLRGEITKLGERTRKERKPFTLD
ncbi:MAG: UbiD family decarboxylase [Desulfobacterales bacterium]|nr:UbiD family decarboxylase [Desulfobacterales bacterium]